MTPLGGGEATLGKHYAAEVDSIEVLAEGEYGVEDNQRNGVVIKKEAPQPANQSWDSELERERVGAEGFEPPTLCL